MTFNGANSRPGETDPYAHPTRLSEALENPNAPLRRLSGALGFSNAPIRRVWCATPPSLIGPYKASVLTVFGLSIIFFCMFFIEFTYDCCKRIILMFCYDFFYEFSLLKFYGFVDLHSGRGGWWPWWWPRRRAPAPRAPTTAPTTAPTRGTIHWFTWGSKIESKKKCTLVWPSRTPRSLCKRF